MTYAYSITDSCIGCSLCAKNCPVKAISGELKGQHTIDPDLCIRCGLCGKLCPKEAILDEKKRPVKKLAKKDWKTPIIDKESCAGCSVCIENCPKNCLALSEPKERGDIRTVAELVNPKDCIYCGICRDVCPIDAVSYEPVQAAKEEDSMKFTIYKAYCRTFQAVMKVGNYFMGYRMPKYISGSGCVTKLPQMMKKAGAGKALVVTDNVLVKLGLTDKMLAAMDEAGIAYVVYSGVQPNPTSDNVEEGYRLYVENGCEAIVAMGGGSPMDCAKGVGARVAHPKKSVAQLQGLLKVHKRIPLFFAVPTTSGTGSETTVAAVITDSATHHKASINDPSILPKYAVLDPELTLGLPPHITSTTGMDALCHAVEAYTNNTYNTRVERRCAKAATRLIYNNLKKAYDDGSDIKARQEMQRAALFAGRAFTRGCVGYVHAVGHTLGGLYGLPHGLAMSVILPHVMRQFGPAVYDKLADLADMCGLPGETNAEKAESFISWIEQMKEEMNIPVGVDCIKDEDIEQIIDWAMKEANPLYPVPVIWGRDDFRKLIDTIRA